jgi:hypothetical protein
MKNKIILVGLIALIIFVSSFDNGNETQIKQPTLSNKVSLAPTEEESKQPEFNFPFVGNSFNGFREAVAFKESQGRYGVVNSLGYLGKYQFGKSTLKRFNIHNTKEFLNDPELQEDAFIALCSLNKWILRKDIERSVGQRINGIVVTESGILAAAHLAGAGNVKKYLRSQGSFAFTDAFGSSLQYYLRRFSGFDTSFIEQNQKPVV